MTILDDSELNETIYSPVCSDCKHLHSLVNKKCSAYPEGIPDVIWNGKDSHTKIRSDQNNSIIYEPRINDSNESVVN